MLLEYSFPPTLPDERDSDGARRWIPVNNLSHALITPSWKLTEKEFRESKVYPKLESRSCPKPPASFRNINGRFYESIGGEKNGIRLVSNPTSPSSRLRSVPFKLLLCPLALIYRYRDLTGRRLRLSPISYSWRWVCNCFSRTLVVCKSPSTTSVNLSFWLFGWLSIDPRYVNGWKVIGIMTSSLRSGDYRNLFSLVPICPSNIEPAQVLISNTKESSHESKRPANHGIMIPPPWSGDYRRFSTSRDLFLSSVPLSRQIMRYMTAYQRHMNQC